MMVQTGNRCGNVMIEIQLFLYKKPRLQFHLRILIKLTFAMVKALE